MPSGGTGATAKVYIQAEVIDNFKEQAAKIKSGLGKGLKDLKDLDLNFAFDEKDTAKAVGMELDKITTMLSDKKLSQLDFGSILPAIVNHLNDDSISDTVKWQLVQGFREGLDEIKKLSSSDLKAFMRTGDDLAAGIMSNSAIQEIINSLLLTGSDKTNIQYEFQDTILKIMGNNRKKAAQDVTKLISLKQLQDKDNRYSDVLKYLISGTVGEDETSIFDLSSINKSIDVQTLKEEKANAQGRLSAKQYKDLAGYVARLKYLSEYATTDKDKENYGKRYHDIIDSDAYKTLIANATQNQKQAMNAVSILVEQASAERDALYQSINQSDFIDPEKGFYNIIKQLSLLSGQHGTASKMLPLWFEKGSFLKEFTIEELLPNTMRMGFEDNGLTEGNADDSTNVKRAEDAADRAEDAANKAEKARDETKKMSQEVKDAIEKGTNDKKASKKENEPPSSEPATRAEKKEEEAVESSNETLRQEEEVQRELENIQKQRKQLKKERDKLSEESNNLQAEAQTAKTKYEEIERDLEKAKNERNNSNQELSQRTGDKNRLEKNITTRESNIKKIDDKIDEIREQKNKLKKELSDYNKETEQLFKSEEYQQQKEAYEQREAVIAEMKQALSNSGPLQINEEIGYYNQILDNKVTAKGEDESLKLVQEKAEQLKTRKKDLEAARTNLENATDEDREELTKIEATLSKKYTLSKVDFLQSIQNAREQGVKDKDLVSYFNENPEQYGLKESISKVVKKDGTFAKRFDSTIQKELDDIINPIKQQLDKKKAELKVLQERLNALDAQMADLNTKIGNYEKNTPEKREAAAQKKQKEIDELERQEGNLLSKRQREDNALQQDKDELARPRYQKLDEAKAENNQLKTTVQQLQADAKEAKKASKQAEDAAKAKQDALQEVENQLRVITEEETKLNNELNVIRERKQSEAPSSSEPEPEHVEEEAGQVRKTRKDLENERQKLKEAIQQSTQTMEEANDQMILIDKKINQTQQSEQRNSATVDKLTEKKTQIESQIQQTKDELKTIKERLQDAVDAKQAAEEEIRGLEEKLLNADGSNIFTADTPENASKYNKLKEKRDYADFELNSMNQPILDDLLQERQSFEDALNRSYSVKTMDEAYKQAMQRKKEYLEKNKKYAEAVDETQKYETGSADWMVKTFNQQQVSAEQDAAWMAYYKSMQEFESHGRGETASKRSKREKLYAGVPSLEIPSEENAELVLSNLQSYLDRLHKQIKDRKKLVELSQKELDELQQKIDELSSHVVTTDSISKKIEQKKQEQQKFEREEIDWTTQQNNKQTELDNLNEQLNGTKGVANYLKATQDVQQNNKEELQRFKQQRDEQKAIYDEAVKIQQEKKAQLEKLNQLITEAEARESAPSVTSTTNDNSNTTPLSSSGSQTADGVHQEGAEADDAAAKMKALADAKKEALEANQKLAESADVTNKALKGEGDSAIEAEFNALFLALSEIYDLLSQFPIVFSQFNQGLDIAPLTEQFKALSDLINGLPKEGFNLSLGEGLDTFIGKIDDALNKLNDFLTAFNTQKGSENITKEYAEQIKQIIDGVHKALEANQKLTESAINTKEAVQNESDTRGFDVLIIALTEIYELLSQLPQMLKGFGEIDLNGITEPLNNLSQVIKELPKEGFNISLGDSFDNLANRIDEVLQKLQEFTSEIKIKETKDTIAKQYDEQIKLLTNDLKEAKKAIEELKKAQTIKQSSSIDEYDPTLDSTTARTRKRNVAKRISKQQTPEIDPLAKEYGLLYQAQQESFKANNIDEYNAALEKSESILQRINELEQKIFSDYGKNPYQDELLSCNYSQLLQDNSQNKNNVQASKNNIENFIEKQNAEIENLENRVNNIQLIPEEAQTNWDQAYIDKYNSIKESAQEVTTTIQILKETLAQAGATGLDQNTLRAFLEFKQSATEQVASTQKENDTFKSNIASMSNEYISKLSEVENRLLTIKKNSEKLINIDPSIGNTLLFVEQYLSKIKDLKETVSKEPLAIYDSDVKGRIDTTISELTDKKNEEDEQTMLEQMEQVSERSQTDLDRIVNNYSRYTTALNKLFTDIAKGSKSSADELEKDFQRINDFSSKLVNATGLEQGDLLKGELKSSASPRIVDAQTEAYNKNAIAFEGMYTKIESKAESAKNKIEEIFGDMDITKSLDEKFIGGNVKGFDEFVQKATQVEKVLERLEKIQGTIKTDDTWLLQKKNADELRQTIATLETSLASVSKASSNFKIVDDLDVQKLRASTKQYIRDNPALTGGEVSELNNYIDQLQNKINSVDFKNIEDGIQGVQQKAQEAGHTGETFMSMLTQRFKSLGAYLLSFVSFYEVIGVFKQGIGIIHELDDALTEMQKVSDESLASLREYQQGTFATANEIGTTAAQLQQSTADWLRLGEDLQQASQSAQTANILFNVSEFESIDDATTALVAMSAAYADAEKDIDKMDIVDRLNLIGNNYAIATDELATALQDGAATLQTAGNDLDEAIALTTAGNEKIA